MEGKTYQVSDELMIDELMEERSELSDFLKIVDKSEMRGTIHAYGTYTFFAPTNDGVSKFLSKIGKSLTDITKEEALEIVKYHLVKDTIPTSGFVDGRLMTSNFSNKFITTKVVTSDSGVEIELNRASLIKEKDVRGANGYLHVVDNVLSHPMESISDRIRALPEEYSLMKEIFEMSNFAKTMENLEESETWYTFFIQDNNSFQELGIETVEDLLVRLREKTPDITDDQVLIYNYVAYHCIPQLSYVADLLMTSALMTIVPNQVITVKREYEQVKLNEFETNGVLEPGILVDRTSEYTDLSCSDGVIHKINGNIEIVKRSAYRVYWDLAEQPEIMALKGFRKAGTSVIFEPGDLSEINWGGRAPYTLEYYSTGYPNILNKDNNFINGDYIAFTRLSSNTASWAEFKTPVLVEGKYKVWIGMRFRLTASGSVVSQDMRAIFKQDGQDDQNLGVTNIYYGKSPGSYNLTEINTEFHQRMELDGQKIYTASYYDTANPCFYLGAIEVTTTGRHTFRWEALTEARFWPCLDVIHFIPIDDDQIWPKQDLRGKLIYENTPDCEIYPYTNCEEETPVEE